MMTLPKKINAAVTLAILAIMIVATSWTFAHAAGTTVSLCLNNNGSVYAIGPTFSRQACKNNDQLATIITGTSDDVFSRVIRTNKSIYAPGELVSVACGASNTYMVAYDITPGIDGKVANNGILLSQICTGSAQRFYFNGYIGHDLEIGHTYSMVEAEGDSNCRIYDYSVCKTNTAGSGEAAFINEARITVQ